MELYLPQQKVDSIINLCWDPNTDKRSFHQESLENNRKIIVNSSSCFSSTNDFQVSPTRTESGSKETGIVPEHCSAISLAIRNFNDG